MADLERDVLYETMILRSTVTMKLTWNNPNYLTNHTTNEPTIDGLVVGQQFHLTKKQLNKSERKYLKKVKSIHSSMTYS